MIIEGIDIGPNQGMFRMKSEVSRGQNPEQCHLIGRSRRNLKGY